jgi:flagellar operon protein
LTDAARRIQQSLGSLNADRIKKSQVHPGKVSQNSFQDILSSEKDKISDEVRFSAHAQLRLQERNINLTAESSMRLRDAINKVVDKGGRESLVLMDDLAFVISAPNRLVITAMDSAQLRENVFTNIDSAIIV